MPSVAKPSATPTAAAIGSTPTSRPAREGRSRTENSSAAPASAVQRASATTAPGGLEVGPDHESFGRARAGAHRDQIVGGAHLGGPHHRTGHRRDQARWTRAVSMASCIRSSDGRSRRRRRSRRSAAPGKLVDRTRHRVPAEDGEIRRRADGDRSRRAHRPPRRRPRECRPTAPSRRRRPGRRGSRARWSRRDGGGAPTSSRAGDRDRRPASRIRRRARRRAGPDPRTTSPSRRGPRQGAPRTPSSGAPATEPTWIGCMLAITPVAANLPRSRGSHSSTCSIRQGARRG